MPTREQIIVWAKANPRLAVAVGAVVAGMIVALLAVGGILLFAPRPQAPEVYAPPSALPAVATGRNWLDGTPDNGPAQRPFAVMIENHVDSRPQSGLSAARLVFEAPVEGGITRFLAVFAASGTVREIGPVRSARPYYLDWAGALGADYAHVGGSPDALALIRSRGMNDVDEFSAGATFWRSSKRLAPHNAYTSTDLLAAHRDDRGWSATSTAAGWRFADDAAVKPTSTPNLVINFSTPSYRAEWRYAPEQNVWRRFEAGDPMNDKDGTPITAANVVVMRTETRVLDDVGRLSLRTTGSGPAWMFRDGRMIAMRWKKRTVDDALRFETVDGKEVALTPGVTWIEVTTADMPVRFGATL